MCPSLESLVAPGLRALCVGFPGAIACFNFSVARVYHSWVLLKAVVAGPVHVEVPLKPVQDALVHLPST